MPVLCLYAHCSSVQAKQSRSTVRAESSFSYSEQSVEKLFAFQKSEGAFKTQLGLRATCVHLPLRAKSASRYVVWFIGVWLSPLLVGREVICNYCWGPWIKAVRKFLSAFISFSLHNTFSSPSPAQNWPRDSILYHWNQQQHFNQLERISYPMFTQVYGSLKIHLP